MNESTFAELAAGHALHALSPDDERAFATARADHPEWEHHVRADVEVTALMADAAEPVAAPPALRAALLERIGSLPQQPEEPAGGAGEPVGDLADAPAAATRPTRRSRISRAWFALAASVVLLVGIGGGFALVAQQNAPTSPAVVALEQIEDAPDAQSASTTLPTGGEATVHWSSSVGEAVLVSEGLPPIQADQSYELWYVRGEQPIAAGVFEADESGDATARLAGEMAPGDVIAVTVEPEGGSPDGVPTSEPILAIPTA
ncbi:anti-sigma factor [Microbacterium sp. LRZ72]|uniref:anti-sigma factor n=1 Tax=Microbacterium sp. LRZ72 TaxID=2942481 RepID=UPI0029BB5664|nr:anti-sigma factor [Microbacterium sp. LRZ72]MDX2375977.1 anti-sigma factor [Microbacterium sp. LRZ72]